MGAEGAKNHIRPREGWREDGNRHARNARKPNIVFFFRAKDILYFVRQKRSYQLSDVPLTQANSIVVYWKGLHTKSVECVCGSSPQSARLCDKKGSIRMRTEKTLAQVNKLPVANGIFAQRLHKIVNVSKNNPREVSRRWRYIFHNSIVLNRTRLHLQVMFSSYLWWYYYLYVIIFFRI